jgi:IS605 OrfB family transposase
MQKVDSKQGFPHGFPKQFTSIFTVAMQNPRSVSDLSHCAVRPRLSGRALLGDGVPDSEIKRYSSPCFYFLTLTTETKQAIRTQAVYNSSNHLEKSMNGASSTNTKVLRLRLKDKHAQFLAALAREVNFVWNYCNDLQITMFNRDRRFLSGYDFAKFTRGATKEGLHLHSQTVQAIAEEYATRRRQCRKMRLSWRKSTGSRRSLGWIPFKASAIQAAHGQVKFAGQWLSLWDSYGLDAYRIRAGNLCEDARGRWYLNACVAVPVAEPADRSRAKRDVGIDLGLKDLAATSAGEKLSAPQFYRGFEAKLALAQRAGNKSRVRAIHAKIGNRRKDFLHQFSTRLVRRYDTIFVGKVSASALVKTPHAKSVLDAGWSAFRTMLRYKCAFAGATFADVNEAFSTQTCSACGVRSGPQGIAGLGIRAWTCGECGTVHDRDVNAAKNILAAGRRRLVEEIPALLRAREDVNVTKWK